MAVSGAPVSPVVSLARQRARRFLRHLAREPFFAVVIRNGKVTIYSKDVDNATIIETMSAVVDSMCAEQPAAG